MNRSWNDPSGSRCSFFLLLLLLAGCASGDRMLRISPFSDAPPQPDRVNLWPLWYADAGRNAVLWPLIDWDDHGFALRPLVARDGDDLDLLWPFAHVDLADGDFWALTAYHDDDSNLHGLFPLCGWGELAYVGPAWWSYDRRDSFELDGFGLFPLLWRDQDDDSTVVFPLWWDFDTPDHSAHSETLFPLWHYASEGDRRRLITPLGGRGWSADGSTRFVNVLGPLYHSSTTATDSYTAVLWPLFIAERGPDRSSTALHPFWQHEHDARNDETSLLLGLARHLESADGDAWRAWPLFVTTSEPSQESFFDLFTLYGRHQQPDADRLRLGTSLLFQMDRWDLDAPPPAVGPAEGAAAAPSFVDSSWEAHVATFFSFGHDAAPPIAANCCAPPLSEQPGARLTRDHAGFLFDWFLWETTELIAPSGAASTASTTVGRHVRVPLLYEWESDARDSEWDTLLWCVHATDTPEESRFVAGWGLYRSVEQAGRTSRDLFPFITWDRDETADTSSFSFLWRLWHRERRGDRTGGHLFFLPWGDGFDGR